MNVGDLVSFRDFYGRDHRATVTRVHSDDVLDLELVGHALSPLRRIRRASSPAPFCWTVIS